MSTIPTDAPRLRILAISQDFSRRNPSGSALLRLLNELADAHDITCLSGGARPDDMDARLAYCPVYRPRRGGLLFAFLIFHLSHVLAWLRLRRRPGGTFDVIQTIDAESFLGTVVTFHYCDAAYLRIARQHGLLSGAGVRGRLAALQGHVMYRLRAAISRRVCRSPRTRAIICLSQGLAAEVRSCYRPSAPIVIIPNALP